MPSFDATEWAAAFCKVANDLGYKDAEGKPIDDGWMTSWFASALMRRGANVRPMTAHEKECALAACALRMERAIAERDRNEAREWRSLIRDIVAAPIADD